MRLQFETISRIAEWWKHIGGLMKVEVAALEPLLWSEKNLRIEHVIMELKSLGFNVSMTTNGSLLSSHTKILKISELDLLRISWHSMHPETYRQITGGGKLEKVMNGVCEAVDSGLNVSINRVLLRNNLCDLKAHIEFIDRHRIRLKLLDLYWTDESKEYYERYYISPQEALEDLIETGYLLPYNDTSNNYGRTRIKFSTPNNGTVEYKLQSSARKEAPACESCFHKTNCLEGFADYLRVFPDGFVSLCYIRKDLSYNIIEIISEFYNNKNKSIHAREIIENAPNIPLRLVLEGRCNFNCGFPDSSVSWCLKQGRGFYFPSRKGV